MNKLDPGKLEKMFSKITWNPETEEEFLETLNFLAIMLESLVSQALGYSTGFVGIITYGTGINESKVKRKILKEPIFELISLYLTRMSENLKFCPHPEDGEKKFKEWFEKTAQKYHSSAKYHDLFSLAKKNREIIA